MKDNQIIVYTGWTGTTSAFMFQRIIGLHSSQWATAKTAALAEGMKDGWGLDDLYKLVRPQLTEVNRPYTDIKKVLRGFSGWPYNLFWKHVDEDADIDCKFIHGIKTTESWAEQEIGMQTVRTIPLETFHEHADYIYGSRMDSSSPIEVWQMWIDTYKNHNTDIIQYFSDKPDRFLLIDFDVLTNEEKSRKWCEFLEISYSGQEYPSFGTAEWENITNQRKIQADAYQNLWNSRKPNLNFN